MADALIGHSGFVGSTLQRQRRFDAMFRSSDIDRIRGQSFDTVVCAAAPAQKWLANRDPGADLANIRHLIDHLDGVECRRMVLVSTVDVFANPLGVDEDTRADARDSAYGAHRLLLERHVQERFANHLIVRLPGLVGPGLRKNVLYDFRHANQVDAIDSRGVFQFYPMVNLWPDIETASAAGLSLVHLTAEPLSVADVARAAFGITFANEREAPPAHYDLRSRHAALFGGGDGYQYDRRASLLAIRAYAQSVDGPVAGATA